jgi:hypothetical protein
MQMRLGVFYSDTHQYDPVLINDERKAASVTLPGA